MAFGNYLVTLIYGSQYAGLGLVIAILSLNILVNALALGVGYGIWAMERADLNFRIEMVRVLMTVTLGVGLVYFFGLIGVAWGLLLGNMVVLISRALVFKKINLSNPQ